MQWDDILYSDSGDMHTYTSFDYEENTEVARMFENFYKLVRNYICCLIFYFTGKHLVEVIGEQL